ncbi:DUF4412 domain-containing protein [Candidatus Magnetaquicoccus inordinatus]|uniref:DUF4412 domain-containing protein n=1 Tax=Candidatus Magnetaquicoccus inordinatus TaxID=2496818 RepID=UPI00102B44AC|nr:DUF4412 domain-containing protein [Candidatus Magnetaquicoccus inordinatus]
MRFLQHRTIRRFAILLGLSALLSAPATSQAAIWYSGEFSADIIINDPRTPESKARGSFHVGKDRFRAEGVHQGKQKVMIVLPQEHKVWMLHPEEKTFYAGAGNAPIPPKPDIERLPGDKDGPCKQERGITCSKLGNEKLNGVDTEKWEITITPPPPPPGQPVAKAPEKQKVLLWTDPQRRIIIRQQPDVGPAMERVLVATEKVNGRDTEKWNVSMSYQGKSQGYIRWVDSSLRVPVREEENGQVLIELVNIQEKAQPASLFEIPKEYKEVAVPPLPMSQIPGSGEMGHPQVDERSAPTAQPGKMQYR